MKDDRGQRERLRQKFAILGQKAAEPMVPAAPASTAPRKPRTGLRRGDYKGERKRLNLRLAAAIVDDLNVLCLAARVDKNSFCEDLLREAIAQQLPKLRERFTAEQWDALQHAAGDGK
jgi:hypothetical protein